MRVAASASLAWLRQRGEPLLLIGAALALAACLFAPGVTMQRPRYNEIVVLDVTQSMNVEDQQLAGKPISRLLFAKHALRETLLKLPCGSKIGWGLFTEYRSYLLFEPVEVCANLSELRATLTRIDGRMAWTGNSEIAKGLHSALVIAKQLPDVPPLVFVTDGHEAPPLNPRHRPKFDDKPGEVSGLLVGVGDLKPSPIPKRDPMGRPIGFWKADEVMQSDPYAQGRGGSVAGEKMTDDDGAPVSRVPGATPGSEHLSALREAYLRLLGSEKGLGFHRLQSSEGMAAAMMGPSLERPVTVRADARIALAALALLLLLARHAVPLWRRARGRGELLTATP